MVARDLRRSVADVVLHLEQVGEVVAGRQAELDAAAAGSRSSASSMRSWRPWPTNRIRRIPTEFGMRPGSWSFVRKNAAE